MTLKSQSDLIESTFANERHLIPELNEALDWAVN